MRKWHHDWKTDIALRLCGALSCGISYLAINALLALRLANGQLPDGALPFILAAAGFLCASAGSALFALGHHIFDEVEISRRWRTSAIIDDDVAMADTLICVEARGDPQTHHSTINQDNTRAVDFLRRA